MPPNFRTVYEPAFVSPEGVVVEPSDLGAIDCSDLPSMTKQEFAHECDINTIMKQYSVTGTAEITAQMGQYGDFSHVVDFHQAQNIIAQASEQFESLPSRVRERFKNSPAEFLKFIHDEKNLAEARELGLLLEVPEAPPVVSQPAAAPPAAVPPAK